MGKKKKLLKKHKNYKHFNYNILNYSDLEKIFIKYKKTIKLIIHAAAQPSHDLAKTIPLIPPTKVSLVIILRALEVVSSFVASARTDTVKV